MMTAIEAKSIHKKIEYNTTIGVVVQRCDQKKQGLAAWRPPFPDDKTISTENVWISLVTFLAGTSMAVMIHVGDMI